MMNNRGDLGERVSQALAQLEYERDLFEAVIHTMGEAVISTDAARSIVTINRSARALLGLSGELVGCRVDEALSLPWLTQVLERALSGESCSVGLEVELDGRTRHLLVRGNPQGDKRGAVLVLRDFTEDRREFVASIWDELRTPVSVIRANTETLLSGALDDPAQARRFLYAVRRNAERLSGLLSEQSEAKESLAGVKTSAVVGTGGA